jgi:hypothetical protein
VLYFFAKPVAVRPGYAVPGDSQMTKLTLASNIVNQLLLALILPTTITGFADLSSVTLCIARAVVSLEVGISIGIFLGAVLVLCHFATASELVMALRARSLRRKIATGREKITRVDQDPPVLVL